jgi:NAD(P)H-dependent flavin oxidoreductase YrpB (nitropropane dioxygenase family)
MSTEKAVSAAEFSTTASARRRPGSAFPPFSEPKIPETVQVGPYPVQRGLTAAMREAGAKARDVQRMQAWAGQAAAFARAEPAAELVRRLWQEAEALLPSAH